MCASVRNCPRCWLSTWLSSRGGNRHVPRSDGIAPLVSRRSYIGSQDVRRWERRTERSVPVAWLRLVTLAWRIPAATRDDFPAAYPVISARITSDTVMPSLAALCLAAS
jgi:hypothetical protein